MAPRLLAALACLALFGAACCLPALEFSKSGGGVQSQSGGGLLLVGWMGGFFGQFAWLANLVLGMALFWLLCGRWWTAVAFSAAALAVACDTFELFGRQLPADEGGVTKLTLRRLGPGFYLWMASMLGVAVAALILKAKEKRDPAPAPP